MIIINILYKEMITYEEGNHMPDINILVVDDEKEIADLIEIYLVSDGYKVFLSLIHIWLLCPGSMCV